MLLTKKTKILFTIGNFGAGGKERQLAELIKNLSKEKYIVSLFTKSTNNVYLDDLDKYVVSYITLNKRRFSLFDIFRLNSYIEEMTPDVIFSFSFSTSVFILLIRLITGCKCKLVDGSLRNACIKRGLDNYLHRLVLYFYKYAVSNSQAGLISYGQRTKKYRYVLPNGFDFDRIPKLDKHEARSRLIKSIGAKINHDDYLVVMVARLDRYKDHKTFIKASEKVLHSDKKIKFLIVGDGNLKNYYERMVNKLSIDDHVIFLGKRNDIEEILIACDLSVLVSTANFGEGLSNTLIESMAAKCPVIATDNPGNRELIENAKEGSIIPPQNPESLAREILIIKSKKEDDIQKRVDAAYDKIRSLYSINSMLKCFDEIVGEVLKDSN